MTEEASRFDTAKARKKWRELAPLLDRMVERIDTPDEFPVIPRSSLHGDDAASSPYQVSHVIRLCLTAATDHLHALKVLVVDNRVVHVAAPASLARGALEVLATAYWVLQPTSRDRRVCRALRWHAKNMNDAETAVEPLGLPVHVPLEDKLEKLDAVAARRSLDACNIRRGYTSTEAVKWAEDHAPDLPLGVLLPWRICSGFAHGRPWAYLGVSDLETAATEDAEVLSVRLTSNEAKALYPALAAIHLLERLLCLYEQRAEAPLI